MLTQSADPVAEICLRSVRVIHGANFWMRSPVTRLELDIGAYEHISSADVPAFTDLLIRAFPGLIEHRCSIGERGGFIARLKRGTYAPHIIEHVALELQNMIGHDVGFGRSRGGESPGQYTVVFQHRHTDVGPLAALLALQIVQRAFAGSLHSIDGAVDELRAVARTPDIAPLSQDVLFAITGGSNRAETRGEIARRGFEVPGQVIDISPAQILDSGLPYRNARVAIILDAKLNDVPERYRETDRAERLVGTVADAVLPGGIVILPAKEWELQDMARDAGSLVSVFAPDDDITIGDTKVAHATACVNGGRITVDWCGEMMDAGPLHNDAPPTAQVAAAFAVLSLQRGTC